MQVRSSICSLTTLTELSLPYCNLTAIDPTITNLVNLVSLNLNQNIFFPEVCYPCPLLGHAPKASVWFSMLNGRIAYMQVPQELAGLTTLTYLNLLNTTGSREAVVALGVQMEGVGLVPKMRVTEQGCRFLLHLPALASLSLSVTGEERAAMAGFLTKLQRGRNGPFHLYLDNSEAYIHLDNETWFE